MRSQARRHEADRPEVRPLTTDVPGAMRMTGFGEHAIRAAIRDGKLKAKRSGRKIVVPLWAIEEFVRDVD